MFKTNLSDEATCCIQLYMWFKSVPYHAITTRRLTVVLAPAALRPDVAVPTPYPELGFLGRPIYQPAYVALDLTEEAAGP